MNVLSRMGRFARIQKRYGDIPGERGAALRRKYYKGFFLKLGRDVYIEEGCRFYHTARIVLEDGVRFNNGALVYGSGGVRIGRHTLIGPRCFIHSANHDIAPGSKPFNERGYEEVAVDIGEHNLISANVSILPGVRTGANSFVACGAVVTNKAFKPHARLKGVPAEAEYPALPAAPKAAPSTIIYAQKEGDWASLGQHLLSVLSLPQVALIKEGETVPKSVHTAILFGPSDWQPAKLNVANIWNLAEGESELDQRGFPTKCPAHVVALDTKLAEVLFWLDSRLVKGAGKLAPKEYDAWITTLAILNLEKDRDDRLYQRWHKRLNQRQPFSRALGRPSPQLTVKAIAHQPELLVRAIVRKRITPEKAQALLTRCLEGAPNGQRLVAYAIAARLLGEKQLAERIEATLGEKAFPPASENSKSLCYSPLVLAWRYLNSGQNSISEYCGQVQDRSLQLAWRGFGKKFYEVDTMRISRDLVDNWRSLHHMPLSEREHYLLTDESYKTDTFAVECVWFELFKTIQHAAGEEMIRLMPWPAGYDAALSLRYDVDRPVSSDAISKIIGIQMDYTKAPAASWYYFANHTNRERQSLYAKRHWMDFAIHGEANSDAEAGIGYTHHSAPTSRYWGGNATCKTLADNKATYGEWLSMNCRIPRPALNYPSLMLTPLHFPLEGSTKDKSLRYFRRLLPCLHTVLLSGGHVIIGSHPDLNQKLMRRALKGIWSPRLWCANVAEVVTRVQSLQSVRATNHESGIELYAEHAISDLVVEYWPVASNAAQYRTTQLIGGVARLMEWKV